MDLGLQNKTALVMSGGGGLGRAIAVALASEGANVALADLDAAALEQSAEAVRVAGAQALALQWDMSDLSVVDARVETIEQRFGSVDILVNNTGEPPPTPASGQPSGVWAAGRRNMRTSSRSSQARAHRI